MLPFDPYNTAMQRVHERAVDDAIQRAIRREAAQASTWAAGRTRIATIAGALLIALGDRVEQLGARLCPVCQKPGEVSPL